MEDWLDETLTRLTGCHPRRVLEIGCGTGLVAFGLAAHCDAYWGVDISDAALDYVRAAVSDGAPIASECRLINQSADSLVGLPRQSFDLVVLNSVIQYFPSADYLRDVTRKAVEATADGGMVFVGDIRAQHLLDYFHTSVELFHARDDLSASEIKLRIESATAAEEELVVHPALITDVFESLERVIRVAVRPKRCSHRNELSSYRFDAYAFVGTTPAPSVNVAWKHWPTSGSVKSLLDSLRGTREVHGLTSVPHPFLAPDTAVRKLLKAAGPSTLASDLRTPSLEGGCSATPAELAAAANLSGLRAEFSWASADPTGAFDVVFGPFGADLVNVDWPVCPEDRKPSRLANDPLRHNETSALRDELRRHLRRSLPEAMVPTLVGCASISRTPSGKVDRNALAAPPKLIGGTERPPSSPTEVRLMEIWQDLLQVVDLGAETDFFEAGGHSLLAADMLFRVNDEFHVKISLEAFLPCPTLEATAFLIDGPRLQTVNDHGPIRRTLRVSVESPDERM
jgi:SAM-dependent methyltransferase/acyl carrier protein